MEVYSRRSRGKSASYERGYRSIRHRGGKIHLYRYLGRLLENTFHCKKDYVIIIYPRDLPDLVETWVKLGDKQSEFRSGGLNLRI